MVDMSDPLVNHTWHVTGHVLDAERLVVHVTLTLPSGAVWEALRPVRVSRRGSEAGALRACLRALLGGQVRVPKDVRRILAAFSAGDDQLPPAEARESALTAPEGHQRQLTDADPVYIRLL
jgi:hypothetical protein